MMKSILKSSSQKSQEEILVATKKTSTHKVKNRLINSALSENNVKYDEESYLKYNDITSFRHKTQLAEDFFAKKAQKLELRNKALSSTSFYYDEIENQQQPETIEVNDENIDDFYTNIFDNLKNKKLNETKLTNLKHFYAKVRYLNRKHTEKRKTDNKLSRKRQNTFEFELNKKSNLLRMNTYTATTDKQLQNNETNEIKEDNIEIFEENVNDEDDEDDEEEDEIDENEDEVEKPIDQYFYNLDLYHQNEKTRNSLIDVKAIRNYFNIIDSSPLLSRKEQTLLNDNKIKSTRLNLLNIQSAPNAYLNSTKTQRVDEIKYKDNFYKEFSILKQQDKQTVTKPVKKQVKSILLPPATYKNRLNNLIISNQTKNTENLKLIAKATAYNSHEKDDIEEIEAKNGDRLRFNESKTKQQSLIQTNPSLLLSNLIKLRLAQYTNNKNKQQQQQQTIIKNDSTESSIPETNVKKTQSLKIQGIGNSTNMNVTTINSTRLRQNLKLPTIRGSKSESMYQTENFNSALIITKSVDNKILQMNKIKSYRDNSSSSTTPTIMTNKPRVNIIKKKSTDVMTKPVKSNLESIYNIKIRQSKDQVDDLHENYDSIDFYNDEIELLSKSNGNYKYMATSTSKLKRSGSPTTINSSDYVSLPEIQNLQSAYRPQISPLKFNSSGVGTLPPININLHVNNEYNYKSFERIKRNF